MDLHISTLLEVWKPRPIPKVSRGQWIKQFYFKVKDGWNSVKTEPLTLAILATRMYNVPDAEMPTLWKLCSESSNFDKFFWWRIKRYPRRIKEKKKKSLQLF
jgi:hypothetical protein